MILFSSPNIIPIFRWCPFWILFYVNLRERKLFGRVSNYEFALLLDTVRLKEKVLGMYLVETILNWVWRRNVIKIWNFRIWAWLSRALVRYLSWFGLKTYVKGDLVFLDGSFVRHYNLFCGRYMYEYGRCIISWQKEFVVFFFHEFYLWTLPWCNIPSWKIAGWATLFIVSS